MARFLCRWMDEGLSTQSRHLRAGFVGVSLARQSSSAPHLLQVCPAPSSPRAAGDSALWCPSGPGAVKEGAWVWQESSWGMLGAAGGTGMETGQRQGLSALVLGDLLCYVQICRRGEPKALLCKGGGYLAQSREQLTLELSFSGFSCTRECFRPLPCL